MSAKTSPKEKASEKAANPLSEALNAITQKTPCEYNPKKVAAYVLSLFVSEHKDLCRVANAINKYHFSLDDRLIFKYYVEKVPKGFRKMTFTKKAVEADEREKEIKRLMETHGISKREASLSL